MLTTLETVVVDVPSALARLRGVTHEPGILSAYIDTRPTRMARQSYLLALRDSCRLLRRQLTAEQRQTFEAAVHAVESYLTNEFSAHAPGLAVFALGRGERLVVVQLPEAPVEQAMWGDQADIAPLEAVLNENERVAVALFDSEHTRLFTIFLGVIETERSFRDDVPSKQATGGWYGLQESNITRHREDHLRRHARRTVQELMDLLRAGSFDRLLLGGPDEAIALLTDELPRPLRARLAGNLDVELSASDHEVLVAALHAVETLQQEEEKRIVEELLNSAGSPRVVLGLAGVRAALKRGRVSVVVLADDSSDFKAREMVVRDALDHAARVQTVSGAAAMRLREHEGVGAWMRY